MESRDKTNVQDIDNLTIFMVNHIEQMIKAKEQQPTPSEIGALLEEAINTRGKDPSRSEHTIHPDSVKTALNRACNQLNDISKDTKLVEKVKNAFFEVSRTLGLMSYELDAAKLLKGEKEIKDLEQDQINAEIQAYGKIQILTAIGSFYDEIKQNPAKYKEDTTN